MVDKKPLSQFDADFIGRVRAARRLRFETQEGICEALDMDQPTYSKYETRTVLPIALIKRFCKVCGVQPLWLMFNDGPGPKWEAYYPPKKTRRKAQKRRRAA